MASFGSSSRSCRPQFFTSLLPSDLHKLKVPSEFTKNLANRTNNGCIATIFSPVSKLWHVELYQDGSETFFRKGWPEFSKYHELETGFMLVFRYEGNMVFTVKIFDSNGCLKDYNSGFSIIQGKPGFHIPEDGSPISSTEDASSSKLKRKFDYVHAIENRAPLGKNLATTSKKSAKKDKIVISSSPLTYEIVMTKYYISHVMPFPKIFGSSSEKSLERGNILVKNEKEQTWAAQFNCCVNYNHLCGGWINFCAANKIEVGDKCKFVIVGKNKIQVVVSKSIK